MDTVIGALIGVVGIIIGVVGSNLQSRYHAKEVQRQDRLVFLTETLKQLALHYGDARRFLYLEDAGQASDPTSVSECAKTLGAFTAHAISINDKEINNLRDSIWIPRPDNAARGTVQQALEDIISRVGNLMQQISVKGG